MKKKIYFLLTLVILFSSISISALAKSTPTKADNKSIQSQSKDEEYENIKNDLIKFLRENDVDEITQKKLIEKYERGYMWDSWKSPEGYEKAVTTKDGATKCIFKDGSICIVGVSVPSNEDDNTVSLRSFKRYFHSIYTFFYNSFF